jgi:hypothetical protein
VSRTRKKFPKVKEFVEQSLKEGIFSPSEMCNKYNEKYGIEGKKERTPEAFTMAMRRMKISSEQRVQMKHENGKATDTKDISEYPQVKAYLSHCNVHNITELHRGKWLNYLREMWEMMGRTNPTTWCYEYEEGKQSIIECLMKNIGKNPQSGRWNTPRKVQCMIGAVATIFKGIVEDSFSTPFTKGQVGLLKDFWEFEEIAEFLRNVEGNKKMSRLGYLCAFTQHIERGCREGTGEKTGIMSARWEQINYDTRRTEQIDKGEKGNSQRLWVQVPCGILFPWLNAWKILCDYHMEVFGYYPTNGKHGSGRMFSVKYWDYNAMFKTARKKCSGRLSDNDKKRRLHVLRMTHAQWCKRIGVTLENICGDTTETPSIGRHGVGWTDPKVLLKYYLTKEPYEYAEQDEKIAKRLEQIQPQLVSFNSLLSEVPLIPKS